MSGEAIRRYSPTAEMANWLTHGLGAAASIAALCFMVVSASDWDDAYKIVSVSVFGGSMVALYVASTAYHAISHPDWKRFFRLLDHVCIYVLIAGTYTPFTLVSLRGGWGWSLFGISWGLALSGTIFKLFFVGRLEKLSLIVYLGMGWLGVIAIGPVVQAMPPAGIFWLVTGGLMYTFGVIFYVWKSLPFHHAIWHIFVMLGTFSHFAAIYWYVIPHAN